MSDFVPVSDLKGDQKAAATEVDPNLDLSLRAAAGSGKTTTMTARYVEILAREVDLLAENAEEPLEPSVRDQATGLPQRIVMTTFTERAAGELTEKIRARVAGRISDTSGAHQALWREVSDGLDDSYISTIHALCRRLLNEYAVSADVPVGFDGLNEGEATRLIKRAVNHVIEDSDSDAVRTLAEYYDRGSIVSWSVKLIDNRRYDVREWSEWIQEFDTAEEYRDAVAEIYLPAVEAESFIRDAQSKYEQGLKQEPDESPVGTFIDAISAFAGTPEGREWSEISTFDGAVSPLIDVANETSFDDLDAFEAQSFVAKVCDAMTTGEGNSYSNDSSYYNTDNRQRDDTGSKRFRASMRAIRTSIDLEAHLLDVCFSRCLASYPYLRALACVVEDSKQEYQSIKSQRGELDFTDFVDCAGTFLDDADAATLREIRGQFDHVMIDEFQDTNQHQWDVIEQIVAGDDGVAPASVLIVGDEKQSIYRFRGADVTVFAETEAWLESREGREFQQLSIYQNYRTRPESLNVLNGLFDHVFDRDPDVPFEATPQPMWPHREADDESCVEYMAVPTGEELREELLRTGSERDWAELEADAVASRIAGLVEASGDVNGSGAAPGDIAVLLRSRNGLEDYERALHRAKVPFNTIEGKGYYDTPEVRTMLNLLAVLVDPTDDICLTGLLRSPVFGLTDTAVAAVWTLADGKPSLWSALRSATVNQVDSIIHDETRAKDLVDQFDAAAMSIDRWRGLAGTTAPNAHRTVSGWGELISHVFAESGVIASVAADERGRQATANLERFRAKLRGLEEEGVGNLGRVMTTLRRQADSEREQEASVVGADDRVTVMTVHNAKGGEFPVVVVPRLGSKWNDSASVGARETADLEVERVDDRPLLGMKVPDSITPYQLDDTVARSLAKERRKVESRAEEKRTLYVACTRAEERLILVAAHKTRGESDNKWADGNKVNTETPKRWGDFVFEALFESDEGLDTWDQLATEGYCDVALPFEVTDPESGVLIEKEGTITVRLPPEDSVQLGAEDPPEISSSLTPKPAAPAWRVAVSPNHLSRLAAGHGTLEADESDRIVRFHDTGTSWVESADTITTSSSDRELLATVYGQMVHRLCELRPPNTERRQLLAQVADEEREKGEVVDDADVNADAEAILSEAATAISYIESLHDELEPEGVYDEFETTLELSNGTLHGNIDHLVVTADAYCVVDYKTDRYRSSAYDSIEQFIEERRRHHEPQIRAYAAALQQADPARDVHLQLFFTDIGEIAPEMAVATWEPEALKDAYPATERLVERHRPAETL